MRSWIFIVLGIIVLILIVALLIAIKRGRNEQRLGKLNEDFEKLTSQPIYKLIDQLDTMNLAGESANALSKWRKAYYHLLNDTFAELYQLMYDAQLANQKFAVVSAAKQIDTAEDELVVARKESEDVNTALSTLMKSNEQNKLESQDLLMKYRKLRKMTLTKSFNYGPAVDELENHLSELDQRFDTVKKLTNKGDHLEAKQVLAGIGKSLREFDDLLKRIPISYQELVTEFPDQITEIKQFSRKMTNEHYHFGEPDFDNTIMILNNKLQASLNSLSKLQIDEVEQQNEQITKDIDQLYQRLQDQLEARKQVGTMQKSTLEFLNHASKRTDSLIDALDHLNQSYVLTHNEFEDAQEMRNDVNEMRRQYDAEILKIAEQTVVDTEALDLFKNITDRLTKIEERQFKISNDVSELFEGEKVAKDGVRQFVVDLKDIQRRTDRLRLPGLAKEYLDYFEMVKEEVVKLEANLDQTQINIEDITKQLIMTQEDLNTLSQKSKDLRDAAVLTEQALQYANRYTYANEILANAAHAARRIYDNEFDYAGALDIIATALEQIEPGSFKRIEQSYYEAEQAE